MRLNIATVKPAQLYVLLGIALIAGSMGPICVRYAFSYGVPPDVITALRMLFAAIVFTPLVWSKYSAELLAMSSREVILALIAGVMFGIQIVMMATSLEHIGVMINQVLIGTNPIWVALLEVTLLKARIRQLVWVGIATAFMGGALIALSTSGQPATIEGGNATLGVILALLSAVGASFYLIIGRKVRASVPFLPYIWIVYIGGSIASLIATLLNQSSMLGYDPRGYLWVLMLAILAQIIAHGTFNFILGYMPATTVSVSGQSVPIMSAIWAFFLFAEVPTALQILGSVVIIAGVTVVIRAQNQTKRKTS